MISNHCLIAAIFVFSIVISPLGSIRRQIRHNQPSLSPY
jgi:hypothetical protein